MAWIKSNIHANFRDFLETRIEKLIEEHAQAEIKHNDKTIKHKDVIEEFRELIDKRININSKVKSKELRTVEKDK